MFSTLGGASSKRCKVESKQEEVKVSLFTNQNLVQSITAFLHPIDLARSASTSKCFNQSIYRLFEQRHRGSQLSISQDKISYFNYLDYILKGIIPFPSACWERAKIIQDLEMMSENKNETQKLAGVDYFLACYHYYYEDENLNNYFQRALELNNPDYRILSLMSNYGHWFLDKRRMIPLLKKIISNEKVLEEIKGKACYILFKISEEDLEEKNEVLVKAKNYLCPEAYHCDIERKLETLIFDQNIVEIKLDKELDNIAAAIHDTARMEEARACYFKWLLLQNLSEGQEVIKDEIEKFLEIFERIEPEDSLERAKKILFEQLPSKIRATSDLKDELNYLVIGAKKSIFSSRKFLLRHYAEKNDWVQYLDLLKKMLLEPVSFSGFENTWISFGDCDQYLFAMRSLYEWGLSKQIQICFVDEPFLLNDDGGKIFRCTPPCSCDPHLEYELLSLVFSEIIKFSHVTMVYEAVKTCTFSGLRPPPKPSFMPADELWGYEWQIVLCRNNGLKIVLPTETFRNYLFGLSRALIFSKNPDADQAEKILQMTMLWLNKVKKFNPQHDYHPKSILERLNKVFELVDSDVKGLLNEVNNLKNRKKVRV